MLTDRARLSNVLEVKLKPCPFCGSKAELQKGDPFGGKQRFYVICFKCGAAMAGIAESKKEAAEEWNRRAYEQGAEP